MKQLFDFVVTIILWIVSFYLWITKKSVYLLYALAGCHLIETVFIGVKTGLKYGKNLYYSIFMTMIFGFTWWLPLRKQIKAETFTDDDFLRKNSDFVKGDK